jgi:threonine/homoserine/homoserine lactone efflux protein
VLLDAVGAVLPVALAVALNPFLLIATTLVLAAPRGRLNGWLLALGWTVGLAVLTALAVLLADDADATGSTGSALIAWLRVLLGAALVVLAVRKVLRRPPAGSPVVMPRWMSAFEAPAPLTSLGLGAALGGANPKNLAFTVTAAGAIGDLGAHGSAAFVAGAVYVLLGSAAVIALVLAHTVAGARVAPVLATLRRVLTEHATVIVAVVLLLIGAMVLGEGLAAL